MKIEFGKELINYIEDGIKGEGRSFIIHHFLRGVEITLGSTIQNTLSVVETCVMAIVAGFTIQKAKELGLSTDILNALELLTIQLTLISISFTTLKEITMLAMATIRSIAQELRNIKTVKGE